MQTCSGASKAGMRESSMHMDGGEFFLLVACKMAWDNNGGCNLIFDLDRLDQILM